MGRGNPPSGGSPTPDDGHAGRTPSDTNSIPLFPECPDCGAQSVDSTVLHDPTCPLQNGVEQIVDDDRRWFERHPERTVRVRPVTPAEIADFRAHGFGTAVGTITVYQLAPGWRSRQATFADDAPGAAFGLGERGR